MTQKVMQVFMNFIALFINESKLIYGVINLTSKSDNHNAVDTGHLSRITNAVKVIILIN